MLLPSLLKSGDQVYQKVIKQLYQKMLLLNLLITRQILEFVAEQKEYTAALLVESKKVKLVNKTVGEFYKELLVNFRDSGNEGNRLVF